MPALERYTVTYRAREEQKPGLRSGAHYTISAHSLRGAAKLFVEEKGPFKGDYIVVRRQSDGEELEFVVT